MESIWQSVGWWMHRKTTKKVGNEMPVRNHNTPWTLWVVTMAKSKINWRFIYISTMQIAPACSSHIPTLRIPGSRGGKKKHQKTGKNRCLFCWMNFLKIARAFVGFGTPVYNSSYYTIIKAHAGQPASHQFMLWWNVMANTMSLPHTEHRRPWKNWAP